jgi:glucokinase
VSLSGIIAVDVGGTKIRAGSVVDGALGHVRTVPTPASAGAQAILDTIAEAAAAVIAETEADRGGEDGTDRDAPAGHAAATETGRGAAVSEWRIGVGAAGVIDPVAGIVVSATDSLSGWAGTRLVAELEARTRLRVRAVNDVHAHALGEAAAGASRGTDSSLLVAAGTGIGGGIIWDSRLVMGRNSAAGHIGHLPAPAAAGLPCPCGGTGHVEAIASGPAILATYRRLLTDERPSADSPASGTTVAPTSDTVAAPASDVAAAPGRVGAPRPTGEPGPPNTPGPATTRDLAAIASAGDPLAKRAFEIGARALGAALGGIANLVSPEVIVIGGGLAETDETWWAPLREAFAAELIPATAGAPLRKAELGQDAALLGAAGLWTAEVGPWSHQNRETCEKEETH